MPNAFNKFNSSPKTKNSTDHRKAEICRCSTALVQLQRASHASAARWVGWQGKRNKTFQDSPFVGLAIDGTIAGHSACRGCGLCRPQRNAQKEVIGCLVPAFAGLGPPHWNADARGGVCGLTRGTTAAGATVIPFPPGGEALAPDLAERLLPCGALWNLYGPTECVIYCTGQRVRDARRAAAIGKPIANTRAYVVDDNGEPVPAGVPGELWIGGAGVAPGYWKRDDLTAERFVPGPFGDDPAARLYRTGDLVRRLPDGTLDYLGRIDRQVKLRGHRIELGEIESVLREHPAVLAAAARMMDAPPGDGRLAA